MKKLILSTIILTTLATSCKKDKEDAPVVSSEENPIPTFLSSTGHDHKSIVHNYANSFEEDFSFKATVKREIKTLVIKLPTVTRSFRITIWDNVSKAILRTENMNIPAANSITNFTIPTFNIVKDNEYFISMNTINDYVRSRTDNAVIPYPITEGNIITLG